MTYKKALIIKFRHHGDVLLTSPVVNKLKQQYPGIEVSVLVYSETLDMIKYHPQVSSVFAVDRQWKKQGVRYQLRKEMELYREVIDQGFDLVINLCDSWRAAILTRFIKPKFSVSENHVKRDNFIWKACFSAITPESSGGKMHTIRRNLLPLTALDIDIDSDVILDMGIDPEAAKDVDQLLVGRFLENSKLAVVHPGARWEFKCWQNAKWVEVIRYLFDQGYQVVVTGAPNDMERNDVAEICASLDSSKLINLCGQLTLQKLAATIAKADIFIGVDSAPMHMASALNIPTVVIFGPTLVEEWGPLADRSSLVQDPDLDIYWNSIDTSTSERMTTGVSVAMVEKGIESVLA